MKPYLVYITTADREEAQTIGRQLVGERLASCVNIIGGMHAIYWWDGEVNEAREAVLIAKTAEDRFDALRRRVLELHSYSCPCVIGFPIEKGHPPYLDWILAETRPGKIPDKSEP